MVILYSGPLVDIDKLTVLELVNCIGARHSVADLLLRVMHINNVIRRKKCRFRFGAGAGTSLHGPLCKG